MDKPLGHSGVPPGTALRRRMSAGVEGNGGDPAMDRTGLVDVPGIKGGIGGDVGGRAAQRCAGARVEWVVVGGAYLVKGLGVLGEHGVAVARVGGRRHAAAVAPHVDTSPQST